MTAYFLSESARLQAVRKWPRLLYARCDRTSSEAAIRTAPPEPASKASRKSHCPDCWEAYQCHCSQGGKALRAAPFRKDARPHPEASDWQADRAAPATVLPPPEAGSPLLAQLPAEGGDAAG